MIHARLPYRTLPERPSIDQLRKQAKDILRAHRARDAAACAVLRRIARLRELPDAELLLTPVSLSDAQFALAMDYGLPTWAELKFQVELLRGERTLGAVQKEGLRTSIAGLPAIGFERSGRCSYAGAVSAALSVTRQPYTYDQVMAYSGLAFRVRWFSGTERPDFCPSSAIGEFPPEMDAVSAATGWQQHYDVQLDRAAVDTGELLPRITASIERGVPVLGYPSQSQRDLGLLFGYEGADPMQLLWLDYKSGAELALPAEALGGLLIFLDRQGLAPDPRRSLMNALASDNWRCRLRPAPSRDGAYHYGSQAIEVWCRDLERAGGYAPDVQRKLCFVSWFCFAALMDARSAATTFLNTVAEDFEGEIAAPMRRAAEHYAAGCGAMLPAVQKRDAFVPPFGLPELASWDDAMRTRERTILEQVGRCDERAERALDAAMQAADAG